MSASVPSPYHRVSAPLSLTSNSMQTRSFAHTRFASGSAAASSSPSTHMTPGSYGSGSNTCTDLTEHSLQSLVLDSEADSETEEDVKSEEFQTWHPLLKDIENIISRLYRFSALIRKPVSSNEKERVHRYIEREQAKLDLSELESHVCWQLQRQCPRLTVSSVLAKRLIAAALYRRKKILYRGSHQQKLEHGIEGWFSQ